MKVSICVPTYEQTEYLQKCMESILIQTYKDYEVIISDDSSSEMVLLYIENIKPFFGDKLVYHRNNPSKGTPGNWNYVLDLATGDFIQLLHHDDYYAEPNSLKNMMEAATSYSDTDVFIGEVWSHNVSNKTVLKHVVTDESISELHSKPVKILYANLLGPPSIIFFRKSALIYYDINLKWLVDIEYYYRLFKLNSNWKFIRVPFVVSVNNAVHNVTNDCEASADVEVYEYTYLYSHVIRGFFASCSFLALLRRLFIKYGLISYEEVVSFCKTENVPWFYKPLIKILRIEYALKAK